MIINSFNETRECSNIYFKTSPLSFYGVQGSSVRAYLGHQKI